ncbi:antibiotic biosynthesis monooxygenase [Pseudomonas chlororaphis]|uniref:antibiotic biosynthesis monooxygenase n=1 Tax=Pseudomonas chlororaphis TaxID=587753 RepID=UPI001E53E19A|nr:antibiotic biosynthesis monooxygenase [Pseudomonas chlororaphis]MCB2252615.1 antibiotic biosynthesis monooxygenase [Pseudomonas chlororaphis]
MSNLTEFEAPNAAESEAIFLVNVVHVFDGQQDAALDVLRSAVTYVAQHYPSFQWSRLFKSIDGKTVINQAQWSSKEEFDSLFSDEQFMSRYSRLKETGTWEFHLYKVNDYIPAATAPLAAALA